MTLGRSSSGGAIKIKTDSPKGLRAVSCACCQQTCTGYSSEGLVITKAQYDSWRKGGQISISVDIFDTYPIVYPGGCDNGTCSWSYSTSFSVPANTCIFHFTHSSDSNSCDSSYYGEHQAPSVNIYAGAFKSMDESGDVYRAKLDFGVFCPFRFFFVGGCYPDMCWNNSSLGSFARAKNWEGDGIVQFLGADFMYLTEIDWPTERPDLPDTPRSTANLSLTFTPNS